MLKRVYKSHFAPNAQIRFCFTIWLNLIMIIEINLKYKFGLGFLKGKVRLGFAAIFNREAKLNFDPIFNSASIQERFYRYPKNISHMD